MIDTAQLAAWTADAATRLREQLCDLNAEQLMGPYLPTVNPMRWEIAHAAWFYSYWVLRERCGLPPVRADEDALFDSVKIAHSTRWHLPLPSVEETLAYCERVHQGVIDVLERGDVSDAQAYMIRYAIFHEDMHGEAFAYMRHTLGYPLPPLSNADDSASRAECGGLPGDAEIPGGAFDLGARRDEVFVFDVEKWAHPVMVEPFAIARAAVSEAEFLAFVEDGGYQRRELWTDAGWGFVQGLVLGHPRYWRREGGGWQVRHFDRWQPLRPHRALIHVSCYEAEAYCLWAGRRLPTELEWEVAAAGQPDGHGGLAREKRRYPWGESEPTPARANLDTRALGCIDVGALPDGDSAFGCRQMIGNVWEWTASPLVGYPGFCADMYTEYSQPWFHTHRVLRGGAYTTRGRLIRNTWRNFYTPNRYDVLAGFRTCALR